MIRAMIKLRLPRLRALSFPVAFAFVAASTLAAAFAAPSASAQEITVFAAASLKDAMEEIVSDFAQDSGSRVSLSLAGSSALARQIQQGAPADVFISANLAWMDTLDAEGLIDPESRFDLAANSLVLVAHDSAAPVDLTADTDLAGLIGEGKLAMALVDAVPAGIYGKAALETLGLWDSVAPNVAQADNVRAALALVALGEAPYGIVYATDAVAEPGVTVVGTFPADSHPPIIYPAAAVAGRDNPLAAKLLDFLRSAPAQDALARQGFQTPD